MALTDLQLQHAAFDLWISSDGEDNRAELNKLKRILPIVLDECVTVTQKTYIMHFFIDEMSVSDIAEMYGLNKSTVSRTIHRGLSNAFGYLRFASPLFINAPKRRLHLSEGRKRSRKDGDTNV